MSNTDNCSYVIVDQEGNILASTWNIEQKINIHSCGKLFQMAPVYLMRLDRKFALTKAEQTIMMSSQIGEPIQIEVISSLLRKTGIRPEELELPPCYPDGKIAGRNWIQHKRQKSVLCHPCIGNHIALAVTNRELTGSVRGYLDLNSSSQKFVKHIVALACGYPEMHIDVIRDSCGAPAYILPLANLAKGYLYISSCGNPNTESYGENTIPYAFQREWEAVHAVPEMLEGSGCLSTALSGSENIIAKTGRGGLLAVGVRGRYGIAVKSLNDGWSNTAHAIQDILCRLCIETHLENVFDEL